MIEQELLFDLEKSFKDKFKDVQVKALGGAYLFDAPNFRLHLGNDLQIGDGDYWEYTNKKNDLKSHNFFKATRAFLYTYYLSDKTIERAKKAIEKFNIVDKKIAQLIIPFTIDSIPIVSFMIKV
jgi:hypothetical protein